MLGETQVIIFRPKLIEACFYLFIENNIYYRLFCSSHRNLLTFVFCGIQPFNCLPEIKGFYLKMQIPVVITDFLQISSICLFIRNIIKDT